MNPFLHMDKMIETVSVKYDNTEATATIKSSTVTGQAAPPATDYLSFCSNLKCTEGGERYCRM